jgi:hypothetical protein
MDVSSGSAILAFIGHVTTQHLHTSQQTKTICQEQITTRHGRTYFVK